MKLTEGTSDAVISANIVALLGDGADILSAVGESMQAAGRTDSATLSVQRHDVASLESPVITPEGFLKADAFLTRAGIFEYPMPRGQLRELRSDREVFDEASLETLKMKPVTDDHPVKDGHRILVTPENVREFTFGHVGEKFSRVDSKLRASVMITDGRLIKSVQGGRSQLSCGYICDLVFEGGEFDGKRYDAQQRHIRYNHVAVVADGRAGPEVAMRVDSADGVFMVSEPSTPAKEASGNRVEPARLILMKPPI